MEQSLKTKLKNYSIYAIIAIFVVMAFWIYFQRNRIEKLKYENQKKENPIYKEIDSFNQKQIYRDSIIEKETVKKIYLEKSLKKLKLERDLYYQPLKMDDTTRIRILKQMQNESN